MKQTPRFKRIFVIVMDSVGIGEAPDAEKFGDTGSHTLRHIAEKMNGLHVPVLSKLGLSHVDRLQQTMAMIPFMWVQIIPVNMFLYSSTVRVSLSKVSCP